MNPPPQPVVPPPTCLATSTNERPSSWFAAEVHPHESNLRRWLISRFPRLQDIDDLIHDAYVKLFRAYASGQVKDPRTYLYSTARNAALDRYRHESLVSFEPIADETFGEDALASESSARREELQILQEAISSLPSRCRQVFTLRKIYGLSHAEIAEKLAISPGTVEAQVNIAMRRCTAYLHERGLP